MKYVKCASCGDKICSNTTHDFKQCSCGKSFVDGGNAYLRCGGDVVLENGMPKVYEEGEGEKTSN